MSVFSACQASWGKTTPSFRAGEGSSRKMTLSQAEGNELALSQFCLKTPKGHWQKNVPEQFLRRKAAFLVWVFTSSLMDLKQLWLGVI